MKRIERVAVHVYEMPTEADEEADGTLKWSSTTMVLVEAHADGVRGIGYSYTHAAAARIIEDELADIVCGFRPEDIAGAWGAMHRAVRNLGAPGLAACAISAVDIALWDLKARLLEVSLLDLLGAARNHVAAYGSGGFTSQDLDRLTAQLVGWSDEGLRGVKMKVGADPGQDVARVRAARDALGPTTSLFVDANGAYSAKQALDFAAEFREQDVTWFEEPVTSDDLRALALIRDRGPPGMEIAAGEYGYEPWYFLRMIEARAVDTLQVDATRARGITGALEVAALCDAADLPLSAHTAPSIHAALFCALPRAVHVEWFFDHVRFERAIFVGGPRLVDGHLEVDRTQHGLGLDLREEASEWRTSSS